MTMVHSRDKTGINLADKRASAMQNLQLLDVMDTRLVLFDTDEGFFNGPKHPGVWFCCMLVLAVPEEKDSTG